jgi:hypothetical protein
MMHWISQYIYIKVEEDVRQEIKRFRKTDFSNTAKLRIIPHHQHLLEMKVAKLK